jgi:hypothetical protein
VRFFTMGFSLRQAWQTQSTPQCVSVHLKGRNPRKVKV